MHAAFTCGSTCDWVYMGTTMMLTFQCLLSLILGVISPNHGLIKFFIDVPDHVGVIILPKLIKEHFEVGHWARILQGPYKDNISLVASVQTWSVILLLIPRLPPAWDDHDLTTTRKRKRHQQTPHLLPALFNIFQFVTSQGGSFAILPHEEPRFTIGTLLIECGLLWKNFDYHMISSHLLSISLS